MFYKLCYFLFVIGDTTLGSRYLYHTFYFPLIQGVSETTIEDENRVELLRKYVQENHIFKTLEALQKKVINLV